MKTMLINHPPKLDYGGQEALNAICSNLSFAGRDLKKIVLTSSTAGEGKSTMAARIAVNMAGRGKNVLLIDLDLRRSYMVQRLGLQLQVPGSMTGVVHYLAGYCSLEDACYNTNIPGLYLMPAGRDVANPIPLIDSPDFQRMLDSLANEFDLLIVDAPPVGVVVDAAEIAKSCDGVLFIVEYGKRRRRELQEAVRQIEQSECPILGCVIDKVTVKTLSEKQYYRSHYYGNNYYKKNPEGYHRRKEEGLSDNGSGMIGTEDNKN